MTLNDVTVYGTGSRGVLVNNINLKHKKPTWVASQHSQHSTNVLYKISTDEFTHNTEINNARILSSIDSNQKYFVYPTSSYTLTGDPVLLKHVDSFNKVPNKQFDTNARKMFIDVIPFGGASLKTLKDNNFKFTPRQAKLIIKFLLQGLSKLHGNGLSHSDVHVHNVLIHVYQNGNVIARWIDFGSMEQSREQQRDVKKFIQIIQTIISMVATDDKDLNTIYARISRGVAPMNAMGLAFEISDLLSPRQPTQTKRARSSSSSKSSNGEIKKKLQF